MVYVSETTITDNWKKSISYQCGFNLDQSGLSSSKRSTLTKRKQLLQIKVLRMNWKLTNLKANLPFHRLRLNLLKVDTPFSHIFGNMSLSHSQTILILNDHLNMHTIAISRKKTPFTATAVQRTNMANTTVTNCRTGTCAQPTHSSEQQMCDEWISSLSQQLYAQELSCEHQISWFA